MKKIIVIICVCFFSAASLFAQEPIKISKKAINNKEVPSQRKVETKSQEYEAPAPATKMRVSDKMQTKNVKQTQIATRRDISIEKDN